MKPEASDIHQVPARTHQARFNKRRPAHRKLQVCCDRDPWVKCISAKQKADPCNLDAYLLSRDTHLEYSPNLALSYTLNTGDGAHRACRKWRKWRRITTVCGGVREKTQHCWSEDPPNGKRRQLYRPEKTTPWSLAPVNTAPGVSHRASQSWSLTESQIPPVTKYLYQHFVPVCVPHTQHRPLI